MEPIRPETTPQKLVLESDPRIYLVDIADVGDAMFRETPFIIENRGKDVAGYSGEGEHRFRREAERRSGTKVNSSRSEATLA